ncbi:MAG TPA: alpha/beta hydrolase, partial [Streptosporangiaceae bacterium]|nr:alpha/beta hydrolase [Streptosporangiaceae bacterium]
MRRAIWAVAAVVLALTACSGTPASAPAAEPSTLAAYYAQHLNWQPCDGSFECAQLVVPFDYAKPDGPRFTLPVVRLPAADPAHRVGTLVINPG